ncbi:transcriptional enhancer factor TEF-5 [Trichinella spiralis]|uniref:transcriptional enhancer factor TEF-5 n=1 Tax=Trichinella spiralis TaxID=6334 RepID=UPI0001EFD739|nr:transcriptional enhancer factor TEF-5 [Trichinella spiralis]
MEQGKCENADDTKQNSRKQEICVAGLRILRTGEQTFDMQRRVLTNVRLELIPRPENFPISSNRFLALQYANKDRLKIALSSVSNGALVCLTCVASSSIAKRQT